MNNIKQLVSFYLFYCLIVVTLAIFLFIYTNKYKKERIKIFGLLLDLNKRESIILSCNILSLIVTIYSLITIKQFSLTLISMLITISLITLVCSLNIHIIISELIYSSITIVVLKLLNLINLFLSNVSFDYLTYILSVVFMLTILAYSLFIFIRKTELLLRKNRYIRRNS